MDVIARAFALAALLAFPLQAGAAGQGEAADAPPAEALHFESVFDGYAPYAHQPVAPWRQSNDRVGEIGGWRTYAREAAQPEEKGAQGSTGHGEAHGHDHGAAQ